MSEQNTIPEIRYEYSTNKNKEHPYLSLKKTTVVYCPNPSTDIIINNKDQNIDEVVEQVEDTIIEQGTEQIQDSENKATINVYCEDKYSILLIDRLQRHS